MTNFNETSRPGQQDRGGGDEKTLPAVADSPANSLPVAAAGHDTAPTGVHLAPHSQWPVVVAAAIAFTLFGLITSYAFCVFGVIIFIAGVVGWVTELINE